MIINSRASNVIHVSRNDSIVSYLNSIRKYPVLTIEQENRLVDEYKRSGSVKARDVLVNSNQRFIFSAAKRFTNNPDSIMDLVDEGNIGLIEAIDKFDNTKGYRLLTYAQAYINRNMINYFTDNKLVRRPSDMKIGSRLATEKSLFHNINGRYPTDSELIGIMMDKYDVNIVNPDMIGDIEISYSDAVINDDGQTFADTREYVKCTSEENRCLDNMEKDDMKAILLAALSQLKNTRTIDIVKKMYGIDSDRVYGADELAAIYGLTETRINQIRFGAEQKLKKNKELEYLITA